MRTCRWASPPLLQAARTAGWMALLGAPIMAVLFVLFPRFAPLWGIPGDAMSGRSGLSANMQVGNIASLVLDESIAMRVKFEGAASRAQSDLYFRGPVLSTFDGREWRPLQPRLGSRSPPRRAAAQLQVSGEPVRYEVTLEPNNRPWLLVLDAAAQGAVVPGLRNRDDQRAAVACQSRPSRTCCATARESHPAFRHGPRSTPRLLPPEYLRAAAGLQPAHRWRSRPSCGAIRAWPAGGPGRAGPGRDGAAAHRQLPATRWSPASTASTRPTNSGSIARKASASTSPRPSWC